jgi:hypothetical protein
MSWPSLSDTWFGDAKGAKAMRIRQANPTDRDVMVTAGLPEPMARVYVTFHIGIAQGTLAVASNAVAELTGQAPRASATFWLRIARRCITTIGCQ